MSKMMKPRAARTLDDFLVPGMLDSTISDALKELGVLCESMKESRVLCLRVYDRFLFLRDEVENKPIGTRIQSDVILKYGGCVGAFVQFLQKYSQKNILSRIAANRRILDTLTETHTQLDHFFVKVGLGHRREMNAWRDEWEKDERKQLEQLDDSLSVGSVVKNELAGCSLEEPLTEMKYEFELGKKSVAKRSQEHEDLMVKTIYEFTQRRKIVLLAILPWFIPRDDVQYKQEHFGIGSYGAVHRGTWGRSKVKVVVKCMYSESKQTQDALYHEATLWYGLNDEHVLKLLGACHVGKPMFLVTEDAGDRRSFADFFGAEEKNKQRMWTLFAEAAKGLRFLHEKGIVHGNLKCSNLLVGSNGKAKLSDFGFSFSVDNPAETSPPRQSTATRWKAPELFGAQNSVPSFKSDIYSLGMCILEAVRGEPPWGRLLPDKIIIDKATSGELARPSDLNDKQWQLVKAMCERRPEARAALSTVINTLQELAKEGDTAGSQSVKSCRKCGTANPAKNKFCNECGTPFQLQTKAASSSLASAGT